MRISDPDPTSRTRRWLPPAAVLVFAATLITATVTTQNYLMRLGTGHAAPWTTLFLLNAPTWYSFALQAAIIARVVLHGPRWPDGRSRFLGTHLTVLALMVPLHVALVSGGTFLAVLRVNKPGFNFKEIAANLGPYSLANGLEVPVAYIMIVLGTSAFKYYHESRDRELQASRLAREVSEARLHALRNQLQPHFLFNTLNSVSSLMDEDVEAAQSMLARLGDLLRESLAFGDAAMSSLDREVELLESYLAIERVRFGRRLGVTVEIADETRSAIVPTMCLQPLVENAIKHGIAPRSGPGHVRVASRRVGDDLQLSVQDDGVGTLTALDGQRNGVGLNNTRARLAALYGEDQELTVSDRPGGGIEVTITMPFRES